MSYKKLRVIRNSAHPVGALKELAEKWDAPIFAHEQELPYLNGGQWAVGSGQWAVGSGPSKTQDGQWTVGSCFV